MFFKAICKHFVHIAQLVVQVFKDISIGTKTNEKINGQSQYKSGKSLFVVVACFRLWLSHSHSALIVAQSAPLSPAL